MIYVIRLVTGDEVVCEADILDLTSDELVVQNPMELVAGKEGTMYLRSALLLSDDDYLVFPTSKIVYSYAPSRALERYYYQAVKMYDDRVKPAINEQVLKSAKVIEAEYEQEEDDEDSQAMELLRSLLKKTNKKDLN